VLRLIFTQDLYHLIWILVSFFLPFRVLNVKACFIILKNFCLLCFHRVAVLLSVLKKDLLAFFSFDSKSLGMGADCIHYPMTFQLLSILESLELMILLNFFQTKCKIDNVNLKLRLKSEFYCHYYLLHHFHHFKVQNQHIFLFLYTIH